MAFKFSLAALLRFRLSQERQQELLLQEAAQRVAGLRREIDAVKLAIDEIKDSDQGALASGLRAAQLHFDLSRRAVLEGHGKRLEKSLADAKKAYEERRRQFQHARQQREIVEALRRNQFQQYSEQEKRDEQRRLDDLFLLRRGFLRRR